MLTRRRLVAAAAASAMLPFVPRRVFAATTLELEGFRIDTLSDGSLTLPGEFILGGMPPDETAEILGRYGLATDVLTPPCNVTLFRDGTNTVLFDVGAGPDFQPTAGKLAEALAALDLAPEDITHVVFTHAHPDHLWGLLDEFDDPVFPGAAHVIGRTENDYWTDPGTVEAIGEARASFAVGAARRIEAIADGLRLVDDGETVVPGIVARLTPGHTPGHLSFALGAGADAVLVAGDAIGNHHVAFERPGWVSGSDQDGETAAATRTALLDELATSAMPLVGFHLPGGGVGHVERATDGFRFVEAG